jgi:hypothetical protein
MERKKMNPAQSVGGCFALAIGIRWEGQCIPRATRFTW